MMSEQSHRKFFFTNYYYDDKNDVIICRGYKETGEKIQKRVKFQPFCYVRGPGEFMDFHNKFQLIRKDFDSLKSLKQYLWNNEDKCWGMGINSRTVNTNELVYAFICDVFKTSIDFNYNYIKILDYDIETSTEQGISIFDMLGNENPVERIISISCSVTQNEQKITRVFSYFDCSGNKIDIDNHIVCQSEQDMINSFCEFVGEQSPDIITGWNCEGFDTPYLCLRTIKYYDESVLKQLSPFRIQPIKKNKKRKNRKTGQDEEYIVFEIPGISELDYMLLYRKFNADYNGSMSLNAIAIREIGEKKLDYSQEGSLRNLYKTNPEKFLKYNIHDVELVDAIDDKNRLIELAITIAYKSKTRFGDVYGSVVLWDVLIYDFLLNKRSLILPRRKERQTKTSKNIGGKVKDSKIGISENVVTLDATSLYPSIMIGLNISPETMIRKTNLIFDDVLNYRVNTAWLEDEDIAMAGNGSLFSKHTRGVLAEIVENFFNDRQYHKSMMKAEKEKREAADKNIIRKYDGFQFSEKIFINSAYGVFGCEYFRYNDRDIAEAVTLTGQLAITRSDVVINKFLNDHFKNDVFKDYVVLSDTDSCGIDLNDLVKNLSFDSDKEKAIYIIDFVDNKIIPFLETEMKAMMKFLNFYKETISFKREKVCNKILITGKKRYAATVMNDEGYMYDEAKVVVKGIEVVRSDSPEIVRKALQKTLEIILKQDEQALQNYVRDFKLEFMKTSAEEIAKPSGVNGLEKYSSNTVKGYIDGTPATVKASIVFNRALIEYGVETEFEPIRSGDKVKTVILKVPNPFKNDRLSCKNIFPKQFGIEKYIDYIQLYNLHFIEPLKRLSDKINWKIQKTNTLEI